MAYPNNFPGTSLNDHSTNNDITDGVTIVKAADIDNLNAALDDVEAKVGIDASAVTTSIDYLISRMPIQTVNVTDGAFASGATVIPVDDTKPQNTEGVEFMTLAITPTSATNKLKIEVVFNGAPSANNAVTVALFQDSTADALAAALKYYPTNNVIDNCKFTHYMDAGTTSSTTFKVRAGCNSSGTVYFNGASSGRKFGDVMASSITISEIRVP